MPRETRAREQIIAEAQTLLASELLRDTIQILRQRAIAEMLKGAPEAMAQHRDFVNAIDGVLPAIEGQLHEAEANKLSDAATDAA